MSYKWETHKNSPNYTPAGQVFATWGRPRTIEAIAIHWWGDPNQNPSFDNVVDYLCRPGGGSSAHLVATGTGRRVSCLIDFADASWATNSANPYTISIECDPRCRDEDYDVVAELIAQLRQVYGNLPLVPHKKFASTACPGNYDLNRLNQIAATKLARPEDDWGKVSNKVVTPPSPAVVEDRSKRVTFNPLKRFVFNKDSYLYNILAYTRADDKVYKKGTSIELKQSLILTNGNHWYRTEYSSDKEIGKGFRAEDLVEVTPPKPAPTPTPTPTPEPEKPVEQPESPSKVGLDESSTTLLQDVKKLLQELTQLLKSIFKIGDK